MRHNIDAQPAAGEVMSAPVAQFPSPAARQFAANCRLVIERADELDESALELLRQAIDLARSSRLNEDRAYAVLILNKLAATLQ